MRYMPVISALMMLGFGLCVSSPAHAYLEYS